MEKYDTSQLTEFPRFESESSQSGVTTFLNKLWKFPIFAPNEAGESSARGGDEKADESADDQEKDFEDCRTEPGSYVVEYEGRSLPNVLKRISGLAALGSGVSDFNISYSFNAVCRSSDERNKISFAKIKNTLIFITYTLNKAVIMITKIYK